MAHEIDQLNVAAPDYHIEAEKVRAYEDLTRTLDALISWNEERLLHADQPERARFTPARPHVQRIKALAAIVRGVKYGLLPATELEVLQAAFNAAAATFQELGNFRHVDHPDWTKLRTQLLERADQAASDLAKESAGPLALAAAISSASITTDARIEQLLNAADAARDQLARASESADETLEHMRTMLQASGELTQARTIARHEAVFRSEARRYNVASRWWMLAIGVLSAATLAAAWYNLAVIVPHAAGYTAAQVAQSSVAKLFVFSVLGGGIVFAGSSYRAARHNAVVNMHRANALATFDAFVASAVDPETKNAILVQTTQSIFAPQPSGYTGAETDGGGASRIIELHRSLVTGGNR